MAENKTTQEEETAVAFPEAVDLGSGEGTNKTTSHNRPSRLPPFRTFPITDAFLRIAERLRRVYLIADVHPRFTSAIRGPIRWSSVGRMEPDAGCLVFSQ